MHSLLSRIGTLDAQHRLLAGLGTALVSFLLLPTTYDWSVRLTIVWVVYAVVALALMWAAILSAHPRDLPQLSRMEDSSRTLILLFVVGAAVASLFAVIELLNSTRAHRALAVVAVAGAWALVHTMFTFRYAHLYYGNDPKQTRPPGGLDFPHEPEPDYLDFAYFSFIIGMTSQVSDVAIGSKVIRRTALAHGVLSFGFNAIIIALTISGLSAML